MTTLATDARVRSAVSGVLYLVAFGLEVAKHTTPAAWVAFIGDSISGGASAPADGPSVRRRPVAPSTIPAPQGDDSFPA